MHSNGRTPMEKRAKGLRQARQVPESTDSTVFQHFLSAPAGEQTQKELQGQTQTTTAPNNESSRPLQHPLAEDSDGKACGPCISQLKEEVSVLRPASLVGLTDRQALGEKLPKPTKHRMSHSCPMSRLPAKIISIIVEILAYCNDGSSLAVIQAATTTVFSQICSCASVRYTCLRFGRTWANINLSLSDWRPRARQPLLHEFQERLQRSQSSPLRICFNIVTSSAFARAPLNGNTEKTCNFTKTKSYREVKMTSQGTQATRDIPPHLPNPPVDDGAGPNVSTSETAPFVSAASTLPAVEPIRLDSTAPSFSSGERTSPLGAQSGLRGTVRVDEHGTTKRLG
ncbi:hypothetical protein C8R47DRAFT_1083437 [Mycena vitilis]|nr:hypothetical protein C8R47DRAFT_1083437 [Mycena vitilis]